MPIRPLDVIRSQEVTQIKSFEHNRVQNEQALISKQFHDNIQADQKKTTATVKGENNEFRYDAKEKGQNSYSSQKGKKQAKKKESEEKKNANTEKSAPSTGFDVYI